MYDTHADQFARVVGSDGLVVMSKELRVDEARRLQLIKHVDRQLLLRLIAQKWRALPDHARPPVAWVREHEALSLDPAEPRWW
jgi:hypothetical protein